MFKQWWEAQTLANSDKEKDRTSRNNDAKQRSELPLLFLSLFRPFLQGDVQTVVGSADNLSALQNPIHGRIETDRNFGKKKKQKRDEDEDDEDDGG